MSRPINDFITGLGAVYCKLHLIVGMVDTINSHCHLDEAISQADEAGLHGCSLMLLELGREVGELEKIRLCA